MKQRGQSSAFGGPGIEPRWTPGDKDGVGTAIELASHVWFTIWRGILTEVYYPTVDRPQMRDLEFLISDGETVYEEKEQLDYEIERLHDAQGYIVRRRASDGRFELEKQIICDTEHDCVLQRNRFTGDLKNLKCYTVCNPRLDIAGNNNNAHSLSSADRPVLAAEKGHWLVLTADPPFERTSCGYVGSSDGATDVKQHRRMEWQFDKALNGNIALTGEIDLARHSEFTIAIAFGETLHAALTAALHCVSTSFDKVSEAFRRGWRQSTGSRSNAWAITSDGGALFHCSCDVLTTHKDKTYLGAIIAALAIPFGEVLTNPEGRGGYHLVWPRDMVNGASALLAAGDPRTPLQSLIYLAVAQREDGAFAQNFWTNGKPYWSGLQLDEVTYPILLAYRLRQHHALGTFNPLAMALNAAEYILHQGPITPQERWEQMSGYSPSTFAVVIAALVCAACFARDAGLNGAAAFLIDYADYLYLHLNDWTVTGCGDLYPGIRRYYVRINPAQPGDGTQHSPDNATVRIPDWPPGANNEFPARNIVDAGFLELVRYGIMRPGDPLILDSIRVVDHVLKVSTPHGPCWRRFNNDGYGPRDDGSPFDDWGKGRAWPLLTGERGHYELAAGHDAKPFLHTMERLATKGGLLPEQVWDKPPAGRGPDMIGKPTESAVPLAWAHAEYIKLALSVDRGCVVDLVPEVAERYSSGKPPREAPEMWTFHYPVDSMRSGRTLRVYARHRFRLRYSLDNWASLSDQDSEATGINVHYVDIHVARDQKAPVRFTFFWTDSSSWHGCDYSVEVRSH